MQSPFVNIHTHHLSGEGIVLVNNSLVSFNDSLRCSTAGGHPWNIEKDSVSEILLQLEELLKQGKIIALGEIGLDRAITVAMDKQVLYFKEQHQLAEKYQVPVILHCVKAWSDLLAIRKELKTQLPWIFHGYNGNWQTAQQLVNQGCFLSFGKALLQNPKIQEVFKDVPADFIFLETDDSDEKIQNIYEKAAELRHICIDELKQIVFRNFTIVFGETCTNIG